MGRKIKLHCCNGVKDKRFGLSICRKCGCLNCFKHLALWTDNALRCSKCFNAVEVIKFPDNVIIEYNKLKLINRYNKLILLVIDGFYIAGVQRHCLQLIDTFKRLKFGVIVLAVEGGGIWANRFIKKANCTIIRTENHQFNWNSLVSILTKEIIEKIVFVSAHLVQPIRWCVSNIPNDFKLYSNFHSEPSEHEIIGKDFFLEAIQRSERIIFPAKETMCVYNENFKSASGNFKKYKILNNKLNMRSNEIRENRQRKNKKIRIAVISRVDGDKFSISIFINTLLELMKKKANFKVILAGDGELMPKLIRCIVEKKISELIEVKGFVTNIKKVYQHADVIFLPSKRESMPYVLLESLLYKKPIVIPRCGYMKSIRKMQGVFTYKRNDSYEAARQLQYAACCINSENKTGERETNDREILCDWINDVKRIYRINR